MVSVVHTPNTDSNAGDENRQLVEVNNQFTALSRAREADHETEDKSDDHVKQDEHPIFFTTCTTAENRILPEYGEIPIHLTPL